MRDSRDSGDGRRMRTWTVLGPSGRMDTMAATKRKAESNIRYRLVHECGMSWHDAARYDLDDLRETRK